MLSAMNEKVQLWEGRGRVSIRKLSFIETHSQVEKCELESVTTRRIKNEIRTFLRVCYRRHHGRAACADRMVDSLIQYDEFIIPHVECALEENLYYSKEGNCMQERQFGGKCEGN